MAPSLGSVLAIASLIFTSVPSTWGSPITNFPSTASFVHSEAPPPPDWVAPEGPHPIPEIIDIPQDIMFSMLAGFDTKAKVAAPHPSFFTNETGSGWGKRDIIGNDDRQPQFDMDSMPFSAIGRVQRQEGNICTGALVGPRHVATARHCFRENQWISFAPQYSGHDVRGTFYATQVFRSSRLLPGPGWTSCDFRDDFIILVLGEHRLGDEYGYFGARLVENNMVNAAPFRSLGYPGDRDGASRPYSQFGINVHRYTDCESGPIISNADTSGGQSGSPIWLHWSDGGVYTFGTLSAGGSDASVTAGGENFVNYVLQARKDFP